MIRWNNENVLDKLFRDKYNISFNSVQHREANEFDLYLEHIENQAYEQAVEKSQHRQEAITQYRQGKWLKDQQLSNQQEADIFDKLDINAFNSNIEIEE